MARPRKQSADKRTRKIIVWVTAQEQSRYLLNAVRCGLTGPDYIRSMACAGGRARLSPGAAEHEIVLLLAAATHAALLACAGAEGRDPVTLVTDLIDSRLLRHDPDTAVPSSFELIDSLAHVGVSLQRFVPIAESTGLLPEELAQTLDRLDRLLDRVLPP